ncbi:hypothetical protein ACXHP8_23280 [Vibrio antiquarius]
MTGTYLNKGILDYCKLSNNPIIKNADDRIAYCMSMDSKIPNEYSWKFTNVKTFEKQMTRLTSPQEMNKLYWKDQVNNIEAYSIMTLWRGIELVRSCLSGLNGLETLSPAISARSLLELSTVFLLNANQLQNTFREIPLSSTQLVMSEELENMVLKMIWGTRYDNPEPYLQQTNVMTSLKRLGKHPSAGDLMPTYEFLCDIAHPSFIGNTTYWSHVESIDDDGAENRVISRLADRYFNTEILDKTLWALAWSSESIRNAFDIMNDANQLILNKIQDG